MSQRFTHTSPRNLVKLAVALAAALATMVALMGATSSPAVANPVCYAQGSIQVCNNPITIGDVNVNVLTENKILNDAEILVVKNFLNGKCNVVSCNILKTDIDILNTRISTKILSIVKV